MSLQGHTPLPDRETLLSRARLHSLRLFVLWILPALYETNPPGLFESLGVSCTKTPGVGEGTTTLILRSVCFHWGLELVVEMDCVDGEGPCGVFLVRRFVITPRAGPKDNHVF
jgi:hypothetical protein